MMKWNIVALVLLLSACSSSVPVSYYQLPPVAASPLSTTALRATTAKQLWIERITVSDVLSGTGIVYQLNEVKYTVANSHLWASSLEQQLMQTLSERVSARLPGWLVTDQPIDNNNNVDVLQITVNGFHGRYDGYGVVSGFWLLQRGERLIRQPFYIERPLQQDGYDELVSVLAQAWQQEADRIADALAR